jgi:hypothetical protein
METIPNVGPNSGGSPSHPAPGPIEGQAMAPDGTPKSGLSGRLAAVLTPDADGVLALLLLLEGSGVDDEDPSRGGERVEHEGAGAPEDGPVVPGPLGNELLDHLLGFGDGETRRQETPEAVDSTFVQAASLIRPRR